MRQKGCIYGSKKYFVTPLLSTSTSITAFLTHAKQSSQVEQGSLGTNTLLLTLWQAFLARRVIYLCLMRAYRKSEGERMPSTYHIPIILQRRVLYSWWIPI